MLPAAVFYAILTAILFRSLLPVVTTHLYGDLGDPLLNTAILAWNAKHLPLTADWWNFPAFAPLSGVTAFTEHLLGAYLFTSPVIWITGNAVLAYNLLLMGCFVANGLATFALVRELTGSNAGAFVGGLAFAFAPLFAEHATHVQMLMGFGMPVALLGLHRYIAGGRPRDLAIFGIGLLIAVLSNAYLLVFFPILLVVYTLWFFRRSDVRRWRHIVATAAMVALLVVPLLAGYRVRQDAYGFVRLLDEIKAMSATFGSVAGISQRAVLWRGWLPNNYFEASLFPGLAIAALAIAGVSTARGRVVWFYLIGAVVMWALALGPERGPYWLLMQLPGAQSIRVPARAWIVGMLCLAVCAGFGAAWLASRRRTAWLLGALSVVIVAEGWFTAPTMAAPVAVPFVIPAGAMVLDLPVSAGYGNADGQYLAVLGDYRVVNGYSGYFPPFLAPLRVALARHRPEAFAPFRAIADLFVIVRSDVEPPFVSWLETQPGIQHVVDVGTWKIYRLPEEGDGPPRSLPLPLPEAGEVPIVIP